MDAKKTLYPAENITHPAPELVVEPGTGIFDSFKQAADQLHAYINNGAHAFKQSGCNGYNDFRQPVKHTRKSFN